MIQTRNPPGLRFLFSVRFFVFEVAFIEKVKTGSGTNAGQVDLYKEDSTGDIYIKPKGKPELSGENTGYNVSQLKSKDK